MSVDHRTRIVIGVKVKESVLWIEKNKKYTECPSCNHIVDNAAMNFCTRCGESIWYLDRQPLPNYNGDDKYLDLDVFCNHREEDDNQGECMIGKEVMTLNSYDHANIWYSINWKEINDIADWINHTLINSLFSSCITRVYVIHEVC